MTQHMLTDLRLTRRALGSVSTDRQPVDLQEERGDLALVSGRANLAQAVINRLFTRQGELADLGHPDYGSRLYQLVGQPNNRRTQALADLYLRESLAAEERIAEVIAITFAPLAQRADQRNLLAIALTVRLAGELEPLALSFVVNLEG